MKKRSVLIVDPDESHRRQIGKWLKTSSSFYLLGHCSNAPEAIRSVNALEPDLLIMEVDIPGGGAFHILAEVSHLPEVIFTTQNQSQALKAFEHHAIDYLLKPLDCDRLLASLEKYLRLNRDTVARSPKTDPLPNRILVENGRRHESISFDDITHFKAEKDYTWIHTVSNRAYLSSHGIGNIERKLDSKRFIRIHRSFIVNTEHITGCYRDISKLFVSLSNRTEIHVGRSYLPSIKKLIF